MKKTLRKFALYTFTLGVAVLLVNTNSNAATQVLSTQSGGAGTTVTITDGDGSGPSLTYNPSPSILISATSSSSAYAINAMNSTVADGDRNEYAVYSGNTGYYQGVNGDAATTGAPVIADFSVDLDASTDLSSDPFSSTSSLHNIGGGGS